MVWGMMQNDGNTHKLCKMALKKKAKRNWNKARNADDERKPVPCMVK